VALLLRSDVSAFRYWQQRFERAKTRRAQEAIVNKIDALFVRSERDKERVRGARGIVDVAPVGLNPPAVGWLGDRRRVIAFGGAMWRWENEATAVYLAHEVLPRVRHRVPDAELRIFGARPTDAVMQLAAEPGVTVVGEVDDYDEEFRRAAVTLAPAMVDAGLLMKAIRAMAMGCPVVLNSTSARPIVGLTHGVHALIGDDQAEIANHIVDLLENRTHACEIGQAAMGLVRMQFSWERTVEAYREVFDQLLRA
jgi:glycosyltransferase involved in cell wall biosynthesis